MKVGILALQGAVDRHAAVLTSLGCSVADVRTPAHLDGVEALVVPGGESTTMSRLLVTSGLFDPLAERIADGLPVLGTCAGMILLADGVIDGRPDQRSFGGLDIDVCRNGYGRQVDSFETDLDIDGLDRPFHAVFIRAPVVERVGDGVEVLATVDDNAVALRQGALIATAFHPELTDDDRIHRLFLDLATAA